MAATLKHIYDCQLAKIAGWKGEEYNYFNSLNHLIDTIESHIGWSKQTVRTYLHHLIKEGCIAFENNQLQKLKEFDYREFSQVPKYFLATRNIQDSSYHVDIKDWIVLNVLYRGKKKVDYVFDNLLSESEKQGAVNTCFYSLEGLKHLLQKEGFEYTISEIRGAIAKLKLYFGDDFHRWASCSEIDRRPMKYRESCSFTFEIPAQAEWKDIFTSKIEEMVGNQPLKYQKLRIVTPAEKRKLEKTQLSILQWCKLLTFNEVQKELLEKGKEIKEKLIVRFKSYYEQLIDFIDELIEGKTISEVEAKQLEKEVRRRRHDESLLNEFLLKLQGNYKIVS